MKAQMKVVKSPRLDAEEAAAKGESGSPLSMEELMALLKTKAAVHEREQAVIENLKRQGLYLGIKSRK